MTSEIPSKKLWKKYTLRVVLAMIAFYLATFSLIIYFYYHQSNQVLIDCVTVGLYLFILFAIVKRLAETLPLAVLMILIPIAPLYALIVIVTMIPIIQLLH